MTRSLIDVVPLPFTTTFDSKEKQLALPVPFVRRYKGNRKCIALSIVLVGRSQVAQTHQEDWSMHSLHKM
ncbi:hypothetical protein ACHAWO_008656 [Cyclotella atomus]|uniref:Uncharacterized protein n=1 Tax=Cyclotella atomus TaxID=382360 RepID=A0ABD3N2J0_9STRA